MIILQESFLDKKTFKTIYHMNPGFAFGIHHIN